MSNAASPDSVRSTNRTTRWWWVRHAPVVVNDGRCYGQTDHPCNTEDPAAYRRLTQILPREAAWVTSTLRRTHETAAAIVAAGLPGPSAFPGLDVTVEADLAEQHFGDWQGRTYVSLAEEQADAYHRFWLAPAVERPPGGESFVDLMARVAPTIRRLNERFVGRDIIAVAHGGTIRAAIALALDLAPEAALAFAVDNVSVTRLDHFPSDAGGRGNEWRVNFTNQPPR
ncbi:MAG TPA: histidine phosphatase family protein [Aliidongia sp.]|uniref:histidine phosphatase family protein n=1 Tax=Aliidongia sp. TaxID=1914230 RepID=UPI002DDD93AB|nr:histidine phosphatase family protein [Aliidongia sp.]HEV2674489.1 histidine phosphatase family protein [Aliidongia sp.]